MAQKCTYKKNDFKENIALIYYCYIILVREWYQMVF